MNRQNPKKYFFTFGLLITLLFSSVLVQAKDYLYKVIKVQDGDTFIATDGNIKFRVRLAAMDAPEKGQPYSKIATYRLGEMVQDKEVEITPVSDGLDRYSRVLGFVKAGGKDIALSLIEQGLATYYRPTCKDYPADKKKYNYDPRPYIEAENRAKKEKLNIWKKSDLVFPCKYRRMK